ncbi:MAG: hypothetical protein COW01_10340 [Bdellovibrionales bacterium CG12_big_fil_rev_8_21_14_0_65_38_15]|nr:MAG: hypothetical protein COW79_07185 [Bdellovibrionales bacterium CG22_combo_CG10-13_8_21_14_all_38_13]PIQ54535.1 MAG: hypothetical protein COW01_10340 [Bdellovibrionales bacterium CG12_big_fil_rev_8_21_14_0_65_38_15]PIR29916.1 MAG: hypothetical protein COV38_08185 [Bdellovibrionales bacterium CG11_big_fil_rev_8_21_14_0_20_38_13]
MRYLAAVLFLINSAYASTLNVTGFSGSYEAPNGSGVADNFEVPFKNKQVQITIEAAGEGYVLTAGDNQWEWANPSDWVKDLKTAEWSGVDVVVGATSQRAAIGNLTGVHEDKLITIEGLSAQCSGAAELIESCLNGDGSVSLSKLVYQSALRSDQLSSIIRAIVKALELSGRGDDTTVESLQLNISNNKFKGSVKVNVGVSATVKFEGLVQYSKAEKKTSIRLDKAKASFLDVRGKIFDELEEAQSETFIVERPWIYILAE